ncbi:uncharacterized protein LOC121383332 isoform X2 [Gigantopelta aegis]|nr:uncharacterized protein LOC121383332 isoform X2 [Gigantopelta aegis]
MFATESSLIQLKPETIQALVIEAEEKQWLHGDITVTTHSHPVGNVCRLAELGTLLLSFGSAVKKIEGYFSQLESRKSCLLLAGRRRTFSNVRLVSNHGESDIEDGATKSSTVCADATHLDSKEFETFKFAYLCASFPVLGVPDPPSPCSPSPPATPTDSMSKFTFPAEASQQRSTPHSLHDSGVEAEVDDTSSVIPTETLCDILRRSFRLSNTRFRYYEKEVIKIFHRKTPPQLLVEDLVAQLVALENNSNKFYSPLNFLSRYGYDVWQQRERTHIAELLNKFWHFALPFPNDSKSHLVELNTVYEDYEMLLSKLLMYENQFKDQGEDFRDTVTSPLSSASVRLLREFGLRYGIGKQYRTILYLKHVVENFNPCIWYLNHVVSLLSSICEWFPSNQIQLIMVRQEFLNLDSAAKIILTQASKTLCQMQKLFPEGKTAQGIDVLISLISLALELRGFLTLEKQEPLEKFLYKAIQGMFRPTYEHHKVVARSEMQQNQESDMCPILLNILIGNIRDEVSEYKNIYQSIFERYFNISEMATQFFYVMLMEDVKQLCYNEGQGKSNEDIDLLMLGLVYRLNQLDQDWANFIPVEAQTWRSALQEEITHWCLVLKLHMKNLVLESVAGDRFQNHQLHLDQRPMSELSVQTTVLQPQSPPAMSFTQSANSAFSSLVSSEHSPNNRRDSVLAASQDRMHGLSETSSYRSDTPHLQGVTQSEIVDGHITQSTCTPNNGRGDCVSPSVVMVTLRRSSSLPDIHSRNPVTDTGFTCSPVGGKPAGYVPVICGDLHGNINDYEDRLLALRRPENNSLETFNEEIGAEIWMKSQDGSSFGSIDGKNDSVSIVEVMSVGEKKLTDFAVETESSKFDYSSNANTCSSSLSDTSQSVDHVYPLLRQLPNLSNNSYKQDEPEKKKPKHFLNSIFSAFRQSPKNLPKESCEGDQAESGIVGSPDGSLKSSLNEHRSVLQSGQYCSEEQQPCNQDDFLGSFQSDFTNISLLSPPPPSDLEASLPLSGSIIDIITLLQRLVGFGGTLYRSLCGVGDEKKIKRATQQGELTVDQMEFYTCQKTRSVGFFEKFLEAMCYSVSLYSDNLLCLDLCGMPSYVGKQVIGPQLVDHLTSQQKNQVIWGCRHEHMGGIDCYYYLNRKSAYIDDRYEPVTQQMCTRINNITAVIKFLDAFVRKLAGAFRIKYESKRKPSQSVPAKQHHVFVSGRESQLSVQDFAALDIDDDDDSDSDSVESTSEQMYCHLLNLDTENTSNTSNETLESHQCHLKEVLRAQTRLLAYRLNLFIHDALSVVVTTNTSLSVTDCLQPLTKFLHGYLDRLSDWLYQDNFRCVLECLWIFIVQDFEKEADKLKNEDISATRKAKTLIQSIAHLIHFMNNFRRGVSRSLLLSQAEPVIFRLKLYTLSTRQLLALYTRLVHYCAVDINTVTSDRSAIPAHIIQKLHSDLQSVCKCFTGSDLVRWILHNKPLFRAIDKPILVERNEPFSRQTAVSVAQKLLDYHLISDLDEADDSLFLNSCSVTETQYPKVSIHVVSNQTFEINTKSDHSEISKESIPVPVNNNCLNHRNNQRQEEDDNNAFLERQHPDKTNDASSCQGQDDCHESADVQTEENCYRLGHNLHPHLFAASLDLSSTPLSFWSEDSDGLQFDDSSQSFYFVPCSVEETSQTRKVWSMETFLKDHSSNFTIFQHSIETASLVEECFQRKITPLFLLTILFGRKKHDQLAKDFMKQLPTRLVDKIKKSADLPGNECVGS